MPTAPLRELSSKPDARAEFDTKGLYLAVPKLSTIETSGVIDDSELLCHEQLVALDNFLDHFAFRIEPEIG